MFLSEVLIKYSSKSAKCKLYVMNFKSPIGNLIASADDTYLYFIMFEDSFKLLSTLQLLSNELDCEYVLDENEILIRFKKELEAYFNGDLTNFSIPIKTFGSDYQKEVWKALQNLPYAKTETYGGVARNMGRSIDHARAVGTACGANSHLLIVPCHRVTASNSKGGFSCGIDRKEWLLQHENNNCMK